MIKIINNKPSFSNNNERVVVRKGEHLTSTIKFNIPRYYYDIDLSLYVPTLHIQPIDNNAPRYYEVLDMGINANDLNLSYTFKNADTVESGQLWFSIRFSKAIDDEIYLYKTEEDFVIVADTINATDVSEHMPANAIEKAIQGSLESSQSALTAADNANIAADNANAAAAAALAVAGGEPVYIFDCGTFTEDAEGLLNLRAFAVTVDDKIAAHNADPEAHHNLYIDGNE